MAVSYYDHHPSHILVKSSWIVTFWISLVDSIFCLLTDASLDSIPMYVICNISHHINISWYISLLSMHAHCTGHIRKNLSLSKISTPGIIGLAIMVLLLSQWKSIFRKQNFDHGLQNWLFTPTAVKIYNYDSTKISMCVYVYNVWAYKCYLVGYNIMAFVPSNLRGT